MKLMSSMKDKVSKPSNNANNKTAPEEIPEGAIRFSSDEKSQGEEVAEMLKQYRKEDDDDDEVPKYFVETNKFNMFIGAAIFLNTFCIGFEVDYGPKFKSDAAGNPIPGTEDQLEISDRLMWYGFEAIFSIIFILEAAAKIYVYRGGYFKTIPNLCDWVLVLLSILDTFLLQTLSSGSALRQLTVLRVAKMFRLVRLIRLLSMFKELWLVVSGLIQSLRTILWVSVLILMVVYVLAIILTMQVGQSPKFDDYYKKSGGWDHRRYFGSVPKSMFTLFQIVTLDQWCDSIARHVVTGSENNIFLLFFCVFIFCTSFGLLNLVVGIIVENTLAAARNNASKIAKKTT